jgi:hypothetical protein
MTVGFQFINYLFANFDKRRSNSALGILML